ncbi:MAG: GAF domain-containing protein [Armatimonadetes bacterium]|nr:GAF domain-containing protein [Armatimonadota bacterium]
MWQIARVLVLVVGLGVVSALVYVAGTESIAIHLFYLPIIFAGYAFGDYGAMIVALLAAALTGHGAPAHVLKDGTRVPQGDWDPAVRATIFFIIGMASSRASYELRRRARENRTLYEVAQSVSSTLRLRQVLSLIVQNALQVLDAKGCAIRLYDEESGELRLAAMEGLSEEYWGKGSVRVEDSPVDQRVMAGEPVQARDVGASELWQYPEAARREGIHAVLSVPLRSKDAVLGVIRVYSTRRRAFSRREVDLLTAFANQAAVAIENAELYEDIRRNYYETVRALTSAIEARDRATFSHSERVTQLTEALGEEMELSTEELELIRFGAILHDIGKVGLERAELGEPTQDSDIFYKMHPIIGDRILQPITFLKPVLCMVRYHHERWDGSGFPEGLKGKDIPFYARLVSVTDAYERLINPRDPGEEGLTPDAALEEILAGANSAFDPEVVSAFRRMMQKHPELAMAPPPSAPLLAVPEQANQDEEQAEDIEQSQGHQERPASEESS